MEVILLENIRNLGPFGKQVKVAKGYGRNFLIPQGKAVPATKDNVAMFEARRQELEAAAKERFDAASQRAEGMQALTLTIPAKAADEGKLYGSVGTHEIVDALKAAGHDISRQEVRLPNGPMREIGTFSIELHLHAEVIVTVQLEIVADDAS